MSSTGIAGDICKNPVYPPSVVPKKLIVPTSLKNSPGKCANSTFEPGTGFFVNLLTAINDPLCGKSAKPFEFAALMSPVALVNPVPLLINVGFASAPFPN